MKILIITTYFAPDAGAAAVRLSRLARLLAARGHTVTVLTTMPHYPKGEIDASYRGKFTTSEMVDGVKVVRVWLKATPSSRISRRLISQMSFMLTAFLRGLFLRRPDVILIEAQPMFTNFAGTALSILKRAPMVQNVSDLWPDHLLSVGSMTPKHPVYRVLRALTDSTYHRARQIIAMSPAWAQAIASYIGTDEKIHVVYNGIDLERFSPQVDGTAFKAKYGLSTTRKIVAFIGVFTTQNDFETMFAATYRLRDRDDFQFVLVGSGVQMELVQQLIATSGASDEQVKALGWMDYADIPGAWAAADVMLLALHDQPLYAGTVPAKYFEAFAGGTPVAAAVQGIAAELLHNSGAGIAVPCNDDEALSEAVARLLDDASVRQQMSDAGRRYAVEHFDPERNADAYESALQREVNKTS
jgi:glycosyltransferase involved in cell wall biosynthesis